MVLMNPDTTKIGNETRDCLIQVFFNSFSEVPEKMKLQNSFQEPHTEIMK